MSIRHMSIRQYVALVALAAGLGGAGLVAADTSLVVGSTSDAGVVSICVQRTTCPPSGPIRAIGSSPVTTIGTSATTRP
jgi:hypothetical protein